MVLERRDGVKIAYSVIWSSRASAGRHWEH